jgi:hypothetical protein
MLMVAMDEERFSAYTHTAAMQSSRAALRRVRRGIVGGCGDGMNVEAFST